jgi:hypothetical protein
VDVDVSSKANLSGGNSWSGDQDWNNGTATFDNAFVEIKPTDSAHGLGLWNTDASQKFLLAHHGTHFRIAKSSSYDNLFAVSNIVGTVYIEASDDPNGAPRLGSANEFRLFAESIFVKSNAVAIVPASPQSHGDAFLWNSNGIVFMLTSGIGNTWTATNQIAP